MYCCYANTGGAEQSYDELNFFFALLFCKPAWCVMKKLWALRICGPSTSLTFLGKSSKLGHYRKVEKNRLNPRCISCSFFCSRTSHCCSNFFLRNSLAISLLLFDTPVRMIFARFFPKRMKDVRFAAIVPYNFSSLEAPTSRQEKKANWQRSSSIFTSQKGSHFIPYQRKCQIHKKERENTRNYI